jgi:hypothetical protein
MALLFLCLFTSPPSKPNTHAFGAAASLMHGRKTRGEEQRREER